MTETVVKNNGTTGLPRRSKLKQKEHITALAFISVKYLGLLIFTTTPFIVSILYGFTWYDAGLSRTFFFDQIGDIWYHFGAYKELFSLFRVEFVRSIANTLIFAISVPIGIFLGLLIAVMLTSDLRIRGAKIYRLLIYLPVVSSVVAMNVIWNYMFNTNRGIINQFFGISVDWTTSMKWVKPAIIIKHSWGAVGKNMILCIAALMNVGSDYYEAADIDGANQVTKFLKISVPMISPTIFYLLCTGLIGTLQTYIDSVVFAPNNAGAQTIVYFIWHQGLQQGNYYIGSAASVLLTIGIMIITFVQFRLQDKWVYSE